MADIPNWMAFLFVWFIIVVAVGVIAVASFFEKIDRRSKSLQLQLDEILKRL